MKGMFIKSLSHLNKIGELCQIKEQDMLWREGLVAYKHISHPSMFKNVSLIDFDRLIWAFEDHLGENFGGQLQKPQL